MSEKSQQLTDITDQATDGVDSDQISVGEILDNVGNRGFGPLLLIPSLISLSPLGGIPGMSIVTGSVIILIAVQMLFRSDHPWIPKKLQDMSVDKERVEKTVDYWRPRLEQVDSFIGERLTFMAMGPMHYVVAAIMITMATLYFPLALVPMGVFVPAFANTMISLGLTSRDGVVIIFGMTLAAASVYTLYAMWPF